MTNEITKPEDNALTYFSNEENELNKAIGELDDLYDEIKTHYDQMKQASRNANGGRGVLTFIEKQTSNLVQLKNAKASLINNKITLKKYSADLALKQKRDMDESTANNEIVNAIMDKLEGKDDRIIISDDYEEENENIHDINPDDLLEKRIKELQSSGDIPKNDEDDYSLNKEGILAVCIKDKKWKFVGLNEYGKIIKGFPVPNKSDYKIKLVKEEDGTQVAEDQDGRIYKVIKLKSKKK